MTIYNTTINTILNSGLDLGLKGYPIFDESYREKLNEKIIGHYRFYDISFETPERFIYELNQKMDEIMPYYNRLYESELIDLEPLLTFRRKREEENTSNEITENDRVEDSTGERNDDVLSTSTVDDDTTTDRKAETSNISDRNLEGEVNTEGVENTTANNKKVESDTPTEQLLASDISDNTYATKVNIDENSNDTVNNNVSLEKQKEQAVDSSNENVIESVTNSQIQDQEQNTTSNVNSNSKLNEKKASVLNAILDVKEEGFEVNQSELLKRYRETFLNIDMMIIKELRVKFSFIY